MSDSQSPALDLMEELRSFHEQISRLLQTADALMDRRGWKPYSSQCATTASTVADHTRWCPGTFFRFYLRSDRPRILAFLSTLVGKDAQAESLCEPLLSAGCYDFSDGEVGNRWHFYWARRHISLPERKDRGDDGEWIPYDPNEKELLEENVFSNPSPGVKQACSLALPLMDIQSEEKLAEIVEKLVSRANEWSAGSG